MIKWNCIKVYLYYLLCCNNRFFYGSPDGKQSASPMDSWNTRGVTNALPAYWGLGVCESPQFRNWGDWGSGG
ncbi:unnamed protein product [Spodoptera littoralis]|uniref:Uncharacterized protein n=1 Tax=Spodoptera littoralis TaxID=7109 RepID=A0A9P0N6U7_SPOLI|nr:unnamed protein product [Spodoptera littoralis]CAH1644553.1 unnamed protein product [Spodoptera littoralis]